jgi:hypothetical protein
MDELISSLVRKEFTVNVKQLLRPVVVPVLLVSAAALQGSISVQAAPATRDVSVVHYFLSPFIVPGAWSALERNDAGVAMTLHTTGLAPGHAVTVWWVIFNHPQYCSGGELGFRCGPGDLSGDPRVQPSVVYAAGHVIGGGGVGNDGANLAVGATQGALFGPGLLNPHGADIHLVVHDHGPADPSIGVDDEIHSFGVCNPTCVDVQVSVHEAS